MTITSLILNSNSVYTRVVSAVALLDCEFKGSVFVVSVTRTRDLGSIGCSCEADILYSVNMKSWSVGLLSFGQYFYILMTF